MGADYRKFKTPFYEIEIGDSSGQRLVKLPHHILRLVEKVEIVETFVSGEFSTISIDFVEGSREPASTDAALGTAGLYQIPGTDGRTDMDISGSITNRTGAITDLRFSGNSGISFLTSTERKDGKIDRRLQTNVVGDSTTRSYNKENANPIFLFQERNQVKITWGYIEDPDNQRSIRGYIMAISTQFPENGSVRTTIQCTDTRTALDQIATTKGVPFGRRKKTDKGNSIVVFEDLKTDDLIRDIATKAGMAALVSTNLPADAVDNDKQKLWIAGESFHQFMTRLAEIHNCYYSVVPNKDSGKDTIYFIKKTDFESRLVIADTDLTRYKSPGSILKSVEVKASFGGLGGNAQKTVAKDGKTSSTTTQATASVVQYEGEQKASNDPVNEGNPVLAAKGIAQNVANGGVTGTVDVNPSSNKKRLDDISDTKAEKDQRNITLEFTSLGYTKFHPGAIEFGNLGVRYSGKYRLLTVTHTIDGSGYICRGTATSWALKQGGTVLPESEKAKTPKKVDSVQFQPNKSDSKIMDKYDKDLGLKK